MRTGVLLRDGTPLAARAGGAFDWWSRLRGLLFRPQLAADGSEALVIRPCNSIHTFGMSYPLDAVFLDRDGVVLRVVERIEPWRACVARGAHAVVEFHHGAATSLGIRIGDRLAWRDA